MADPWPQRKTKETEWEIKLKHFNLIPELRIIISTHLLRIYSPAVLHLSSFFSFLLLSSVFVSHRLSILLLILFLRLFSVPFQLFHRSRSGCARSEWQENAHYCSFPSPVFFNGERPLRDPGSTGKRSTWLGGARCVVVASIGSGGGGLEGRRRGPGGGSVNADFRLELREAPPAVDVLKLLNLVQKKKERIKSKDQL